MMRRIFPAGTVLLCAAFLCSPGANSLLAQGQDPAAVFQQMHAQWTAYDKQLNELDQKYRAAQPNEREAMRAEYVRKVAEVRQFMPQLQNAALNAYKAAPNKNAEVTQILLGLVADALRRDDYDVAHPLAQLLVASKCPDPALMNLAGVAAYGMDQFDAAAKYLAEADKAGTLGNLGSQYLEDLAGAKQKFAREADVRKAEAQANDLPRVRLETSKGALTVELYENEAPQTVGNFVHLVEQGFYNGLAFHRVLPNFMAQGGDPKGDGTGGPDYRIYCECYAPNHREHFRGTLSMAHAGRDTGGSQFFITFLRTPHLDGRHTVFGRVVEGLDVLAKLQRRDPQRSNVEPDRILKAEVVRKRQHAYKPNPVK